MSEVKPEIYYIVFTDKETGLIGAQNCTDYETAVAEAEVLRRYWRYYDVYVTKVVDVDMPHSAL